MFAQQLRMAAEAATTYPQLSELNEVLWQKAWAAQLVSDADAEAIAQIIHAKRQALEALARTRVPGFTKLKARVVRSPAQREASIARRRFLAACDPVPPEVAKAFTQGERAALRVVADELQRYGTCTSCNEKIGALAGVCKSVVKTALRKAKAFRLLTVEERRRRGQRSLTNVVRWLSMKWKAWVCRKRGGVRNLTTTNQRNNQDRDGEAVEKSERGLAGVEFANTGPRPPP